MSQREVFDNGKHRFTPEETNRGARTSVRARRRILRDIRKLTGLELEWETLQEVLRVAAVWVSTPVGQTITGILIVNSLQKFGIFSGADRDHINTVILSAEVLSALGGSNLIPQVGSLFSALKTAK